MQSLRFVRLALCLLLVIASGIARAASGDLLNAIEYYNAGLDHYFVTAFPNEISLLDAGAFQGWQRTGLSFKVLDPGTPLAGVSQVCRFYGSPAAGLNSHFYSASPTECNEVLQRFAGAWILESSNVFLVGLPDPATGACPAGMAPIYRAWNNRRDSDHRYTTDRNVQLAMIARGYIAEGYGPPPMPVAMCAPGTPTAAPKCTVASSDPAPFVGSSITLTAFCDGNPTAYSWIGCSSTGSTCVATSMVPGLLTYSVAATNAVGTGAASSVNVAWSQLPAPPVCNLSVTATSDPPVVGSFVALSAFCDGNPTAYQWSDCKTNSPTCLVTAMAPGGKAYSVTASNAGGVGPPQFAFVSWQTAAPPPPGFCSQFPSVLYTSVDWTAANANAYTAAYSQDPGFAWNGAWVVKFTVSANTQPGTFGRLSVSEFIGPPTARDSTLSSLPCDFRATDLSGANGPLSRSNGTTTTNSFVIGLPMNPVPGLAPGQTYYLNVRNVSIDSGTISCSPQQQRCDALVNLIP
jgi:hypothetical protein